MTVRPWVRRHGVTALMVLLPVACPLETLAESLVVPDASMARESAESALNGRRLFFTPQQRHDASANRNPVAEHSTAVGEPEGQPASDEGATPSDRKSASARS